MMRARVQKCVRIGSSAKEQLVISIFMKGTERMEAKPYFYRAACVSICVAGMTSASLC